MRSCWEAETWGLPGPHFENAHGWVLSNHPNPPWKMRWWFTSDSRNGSHTQELRICGARGSNGLGEFIHGSFMVNYMQWCNQQITNHYCWWWTSQWVAPRETSPRLQENFAAMGTHDETMMKVALGALPWNGNQPISGRNNAHFIGGTNLFGGRGMDTK